VPLRPLSRRRTIRSISAVSLGAAALTASWASPASADIAAQIRAGQVELNRLNTQAEAAAERYDAGRIALASAQRRAATTSASVARDDLAVAGLRSQAGTFAAHVYESGTGGFGMSVLTSDQGPGTLLDRLGSLDRVARHQSDVLDVLRVARARQAQAQSEAQLAQNAARTTLQHLQSDKQSVEQSAEQAQGVLQQLQVKQAQLVQAARDDAARQAAQARAATLAAEARANAASLAAFRAQPTAPAQPTTPIQVAPAQVAALQPTAPAQPQLAPAVSSAAPLVRATGDAAATAVRTALAQLGKPYVYGAAGPDTFDCSGLTLFAYGAAGVSLPHYTGAQFNVGRHVAESDLQPGDLVFFESNLGHMGMYIGNGQIIHAPHSGDVVRVAPLAGYFQQNYAGAVRVVG